MTALMDDKDTYLSAFARFEKAHAGDPAPLVKLRQDAIERFAALGFPTLDDEDWRFTPLAPLTRLPFDVKHYPDRDPGPFRNITDADLRGTRLLVFNGVEPIYQHRGKPLPDGVIVCSLARAVAEHPELVEPHLARYAEFEEYAFRALNTAFLFDGAFVYLPPGAVVEEPIYLNFCVTVFGEPPLMWPRRTLVVAGRNSQAAVCEKYFGLPHVPFFTNAVTELFLDEGAVIDHYKVQQEGDGAFHVATTQVRMGRSSNFSSHNLTFGGRLTRNDVNAYLGGEGGECTLNGLYVGDGERLIDNHTRIDHAKPHCASHELYKGVLDGKSRGVFAGRIYVHQDAQKTDAKQTNQTLLLSDDAVIDTKPQLEIFADDVKCTHGATVGQLDAESVFYLRSRGIG
ncbi:MAG TPA: Fe-S cluster assembly protein SufD, partial [Gemmataceae bacterium]|nr:Fe-S cluster assembly protein SufD [Gemmataceae bacterium]